MQAIQNKIDKERALDILENAFAQSPGMLWMIGEENKKKNMRSFLSMFLLEAIVKNGAYITSDKNGIVLFFQLQNNTISVRLLLKKIYVFLFLMGFKRGLQAIRYQKILREIRPDNGLFGWLLATDSSVVGHAAGYEIKQWTFERSDESCETIYVETTVPRVRLLYAAIGYKEYASIKHPYENIDIWFLKREPCLPLAKVS